METVIWSDLSAQERKRILARPAATDPIDRRDILRIVEQVKARGDAAVRTYSRRFDGVALGKMRVETAVLAAAALALPPQLRKALDTARRNIAKFHKATLPRPVRLNTMPGVRCELQWRPLSTVGIYVPGGTAPLLSTLLMQAVPAKIAGCKRIVVCTPPRGQGAVDANILAAAGICGIAEVYAVGGAQAIAAMAYGTETIPKVDKICGPGNAYVTLAKQLVSLDPQGAAIDMPAGPSEVMVIADGNARPDWVAADLLAQAEHDAAAQVILVTTSLVFARRVEKEVRLQGKALPRRRIIAQSLRSGRIIVVGGMARALEIANAYAPEHLILHTPNADRYWPDITNAGSVFLGAWTPESAGDYASGTNHVLPTNGYARSSGGLSVMSFMKSITAQSITPAGLARLGPAIVAMADAEGLAAHAAAVRRRVETAP